MSSTVRGGISRRRLLGGAAGLGAAVGAAAVLPGCDVIAGADDSGARYVPFEGLHQTGITATPVPAVGLMAAFDSVAKDRAGLQRTMRNLTAEIRSLMAGEAPQERDPAFPPTDSGVLGPQPPPDNLSIVASVGASLFDDRYALASQRPRELERMGFLANDRLDLERTHGDVLLTIEAQNPDTLQFALRQLMRRTRDGLVLHWTVDGYTRGTGAGDSKGAPRNLMGFKDGTANLDPDDSSAMDRHVWVGDRDGEPAWAVGGSYQAVRVIRMLVEFWDRTPLAEQEAIMGRHKVSGAPLGQTAENASPDFAGDPEGATTPLDAHIRLANPRTAATESSLIFRRGFSYSRGFDAAGQLDQGLAFVSYQRSLRDGFLAVQERLNGEPLEEYIRPEGGGFFFALPGVTSDAGYLGEGLLES